MHYENSRYGVDTVIVQPGAGSGSKAGFCHRPGQPAAPVFERDAAIDS